jgi:hypothetical protein
VQQVHAHAKTALSQRGVQQFVEYVVLNSTCSQPDSSAQQSIRSSPSSPAGGVSDVGGSATGGVHTRTVPERSSDKHLSVCVHACTSVWGTTTMHAMITQAHKSSMAHNRAAPVAQVVVSGLRDAGRKASHVSSHHTQQARHMRQVVVPGTQDGVGMEGGSVDQILEAASIPPQANQAAHHINEKPLADKGLSLTCPTQSTPCRCAPSRPC